MAKKKEPQETPSKLCQSKEFLSEIGDRIDLIKALTKKCTFAWTNVTFFGGYKGPTKVCFNLEFEGPPRVIEKVLSKHIYNAMKKLDPPKKKKKD